ncbi:PAS domain S-box protein [Halomicroarcula sp. GCM10025710]
MKKIQARGEVHDFELQLEKPSGERFWGSATASLDTIDGEEYFVGVIQDITERREYKHSSGTYIMPLVRW